VPEIRHLCDKVASAALQGRVILPGAVAHQNCAALRRRAAISMPEKGETYWHGACIALR
jgi:hypothetical protein